MFNGLGKEISMDGNVEELIRLLDLEEHIEGGYYKRSYCAKAPVNDSTGQALASSIYYLLTNNNSVGHFHKNKSDILHFHHGIGVIRYYLVSESGQLSIVDMGSDLNEGQQLQLLVSGGVWKASELIEGNMGLISEVVIPEFRFEDMILANASDMASWDVKEEALMRLIKRNI